MRKNVTSTKIVHFEKKCPEIKKHIFNLMTTFSNFTLKIETSWVEEGHFVNLECQWRYCVSLVYLLSDKIKLKIRNVKKNNSKCTNFMIKNWNNSHWISLLHSNTLVLSISLLTLHWYLGPNQSLSGLLSVWKDHFASKVFDMKI